MVPSQAMRCIFTNRMASESLRSQYISKIIYLSYVNILSYIIYTCIQKQTCILVIIYWSFCWMSWTASIAYLWTWVRLLTRGRIAGVLHGGTSKVIITNQPPWKNTGNSARAGIVEQSQSINRTAIRRLALTICQSSVVFNKNLLIIPHLFFVQVAVASRPIQRNAYWLPPGERFRKNGVKLRKRSSGT